MQARHVFGGLLLDVVLGFTLWSGAGVLPQDC